MKRIYHTWDKWEAYPAGFYNTKAPDGMSDPDAVQAYTQFLRDDDRFRAALETVLDEWPNSCEHYLSNEKMNRIAWLGQAAMCVATGVPAKYKSGYNYLADHEKYRADTAALGYLNQWLESRGEPTLADLSEAGSTTKNNHY